MILIQEVGTHFGHRYDPRTRNMIDSYGSIFETDVTVQTFGMLWASKEVEV